MKLPVIFGITHDPDTGDLTAKTPRSIKTSIGKPKDSGLHVILAPGDNQGKKETMWALEIGRAQAPEVRWYPRTEEGKRLLQRDYNALLKDPSVVKRKAPVKLPYFTFSRDAGDGTMVADLDVIDRHGITPNKIEIIITEDGAFDGGYRFWDAKGLKCRGDGRDAMRSVNFTPTDEDRVASAQAVAMGRKWFPIMDGCFTRGCQFALPNAKGYKQCGAQGSLAFQLVNDIRLGAKAELSTTGGKTLRQLMACLTELASFTGGGDPARGTVRGIPLIMSVSQFKTNHNNQPGTAYAVRLEFRAESVAAIQQKIQQAAETFGGMMPIAAPAKQLAAPALQIAAPAEDPEVSTDPADEEAEAQFMNSHFTDGEEEDGEGEPEPTETFDEKKAELMMKAEAGEPVVEAPKEDEPKGEPVRGKLKMGGKP